MGALHQGHLKLVEQSLRESNKTVVSIFVNPAQFAPHEDLDTYPRTLEGDLSQLRRLSNDITVFTPSTTQMYPTGIEQDTHKQTGAFIEMANLSDKMEGISRPTFFRGVATVVTKLFNVVQPDLAFFGQKDIQQALILRRMCKDLLVQYPTPANLRISPTARDPVSHLALSSRNAYLSEEQRSQVAPLLYKALQAGKQAYESGVTCRQDILHATTQHTTHAQQQGAKMDYIQLNDASSFEVVDSVGNNGAILSAAMYVGNTRLIDNVLLGMSV
ncbi:Pantoate--beta-alanine ligase [Wallemia ichthyophaga EXF-994]|uniref:Pantoate--beta-alanine ligase n=2 Tax=Wallemia ichthyophaga TaxID=245174 RepID=R9AF11_WALI9|nr:Pantoate--beta-alanine ligase [Wallemia ichthyophaga EXF-994]EOR00763.1 Pantoate--beta-alanine ligase [Wallemia ichthyophaga EXF-994]